MAPLAPPFPPPMAVQQYKTYTPIHDNYYRGVYVTNIHGRACLQAHI